MSEVKKTELSKPWGRVASLALILIGLVALIALARDVSNYVNSMKSALGLELEIVELSVIDDDNPRAYMRFRLKNDSPLEITVERYVFDLYVNGQRVGTSFSTYRGTDPSVDPQIYSEAAAINQTLDSGGSLDLEFTLYIYSAQMEIIRRVQGSGPMAWHVRSKFTTLLPYSHEKDFVFLTATLEE
jgi:hypothetical protein